MKALSIWQPWASLITMGVKEVETRHWSAPPGLIGQRIAVHAAKRESELWFCEILPFRDYVPDRAVLPLGAIVATATLRACVRMTPDLIDGASELERAFGHWEPGRFAWFLTDVERLDPAVPFRGRQGIFDVPDELVEATR